MIKENHSLIGKITKPHGIDGTVNIQLNGSFAEKIETEEPLFVMIDGTLVPFFMEEIRPAGNSALVKLEFVDSKKEARRLSSKEVYYPVQLMKKSRSVSPDESVKNYLNYELSDKNSDFRGRITGVYDHPSNPLMEVVQKNTTRLIPFQPELMVKADHKSKKLVMKLPKGILDI